MLRKVIKIDKNKCNGCGLCAAACHEGAIGMVHGKAELLREDFCDGLGDCLPACPTGAIRFEEREAPAYNEAAVKAAKETKTACPCPGSVSRSIERSSCPGSLSESVELGDIARGKRGGAQSQLSQWPCQIRLAPVNAPYFDGANLLIAADCTAYAYATFHNDFIRNHITLIGCPKLDSGDYAEKLGEIIRNNDIKSVKVVRMEVPCCSGIVNAVKKALTDSGKFIPWEAVAISTDGKIIDQNFKIY